MRKEKRTPLNRLWLVVILAAAAMLSACVRQVAPVPTPTVQGSSLLSDLLTPSLAEDEMPEATVEETSEDTEAIPTDTPEPDAPTATPGPTKTLEILTPTHTAAPTEETQQADDATQAPTETEAPQPTSDVPPIDPDQEFTGARHVDTMDDITLWTDADGMLPDTQYIKLEIEEGVMTVTGKEFLWDTWWISGFTQTNFYIEMDVNSGDCNPGDAYGMILRANEHKQPTRGYLIGFTCEGEVFARRLESVDPYVSIAILLPTETNLINAGQNQDNIFGVLLYDDTITIYPNRRFFTTIADSTFGWGRFGIYVSTGEAGNYTFTVREIRSWGAE